MNKHKKYSLLIIVIFAILLKLPYITNPISDWHSWNQITTMASARYIAKDGVSSFFNAKVDLFENIKSDSNSTYAELPILSGLIAVGFNLFGAESEWIARLIVILFSVLGSIYFYRLVLEETNEKVANIAIAFYLISPMVWYFHRTVMTDVIMVNFIIAGLYHFRFWVRQQNYRSLFFTILYTAIAALSKAYALYIGIAYLMLLIEYQGWKKLIRVSNILLLLGTVGPVLSWIYYCQIQMNSGTGGNNLMASAGLLGPFSIWVNKVYWLSLLASVGDFTLLVLGFLIVIYTFIRHFKKLIKVKIVLYWLVSVMFYFLFVRGGNMEHDYYQMPFAAPVIFIAAIGFKQWFYWLGKKLTKPYYRLCISTIWILLFIVASKYTYTKASLDMSPVLLGSKIKEFNQNHKYVLIVDPDSLQRNQAVYYSGAKGWHIRNLPGLKALEKYKNHGAEYIGINYRTSSVQSQEKLFLKYNTNLKKIWEGKSKDRYRQAKTLLIYKM